MEKMKFKKINFSNIAVGIFCIILIYCFLLAGSPLTNNMQIINVLVNICAIFVIIKNFKNKNIKLTKIEIAILGLILIGFIPIIFRTQVSLNSTIDSILKYISIWNVYIIVKYILKINKKYINYIINAIIIASIFLVIFGIDMMNDNIFQKIYDFFDTIVISNSSKVRMDSVFEYPNSFAMFLGIAFILSIGNISATKQKTNFSSVTKKYTVLILYVIACLFQIYGIIMSGSRLTILILAAIMILWCILERKKILHKKSIIVISTIIGILVVITILCFAIDTPLILFDETKQEESQYVRQINNIKPNTEYNFNFDIVAVNKTYESEKFRIFVREYTNTAKKINQKEIAFDTFTGTKNIHILTNEETSMIRICFVSTNTVKERTRLEIKNLTMNGQKIKLNYLFLPITLVNRIENIDINESSITERFVFIKDGIKLAMQNFFTGFGNDGWRYNYKTVREYNYGANQMHCYIVDLFIQDGIAGLIVILVLFIFVGIKIAKIMKQKLKEYYPIILAIIFGIMHSLLDFDMNFYSILMLVFILIAILDNVEVKEKYITVKKQKTCKILALICMIFVLIINVNAYIAYKIDIAGRDNDLTYKNWEEKLNDANIKVKLAPYNYEYLNEKIQIETVAKNSSFIKIDEKTYQDFTNELITMLTSVVENEQDRNISDSYRRLMANYIDKMDENNIEEILENIEKLKNKIENKYKNLDETTYYNNVCQIYNEIAYKLEEKNKVFKNDKMQELYKYFYKILGEQEKKMQEETIEQ